MNILYDSYIYELQRVGGINRYFMELISRLPTSIHPFVFKKIKNDFFVPIHPQLKNYWIPQCLRFNSSLLAWRMQGLDLIHPTYYHLCGPLSWETIPGKVVITVHDFTMARFANHYPKSARLLRDQAAAIQRANQIICVSSATERDLVERFPEAASRSVVIPLASSLPDVPHIDRESLKKRYFLYVGARTFYKNFALTLQAFALLRGKKRELQLVVAGPALDLEERKQIEALGLSSAIQMVEYPSDIELVHLYRSCIALIYPSQYEGFGLPPLEAMTLGVPVIGLNTSSLPEVVGKGGILLEPHQVTPSLLAEAAESIADSEAVRVPLSREASKQARLFSWERTVEETMATYRKIV